MNIPAQPHPKQLEVMTALGFKFREHLDHNGDVCWTHQGAHEMELRLKEKEHPAAPVIVALAAHNAYRKGRRDVQDEIKKSLNLAEP